jgi:putative membrane protein
VSSPQPPSTSPFVREHLANERTFLAWVRTSLSLIGLGFVLARMGVFLRELGNAGAPHLAHRIPGGGEFIGTGVVFVILGTVLGGWSGRRFHRVRRGIDESRFEPALNVANLVTGVVVVGGLLIVTLIVWRILIQGAES